MSDRRKKDVLNETWTKDTLSKSLKKEKKLRENDETYKTREKRERNEDRHKSRSDRHRESSGRRRGDDEEYSRKHGEKKEKERSERRREGDNEKYYTVNGEERKQHKRDKHDKDDRYRDHKSKKSERRYIEEEESSRRRHRDDRDREDKKRTSDKRRQEEDEDERRHRKDRERDEKRRSSGKKNHEEEGSDRRHRKDREERSDAREKGRSHRSEREKHQDDREDEDSRRRDHKRREDDGRDDHRSERKGRHQREKEEDYEKRKRREHDKENRRDKEYEDKKRSRSSKHSKDGRHEKESPNLDPTNTADKKSSHGRKSPEKEEDYNYDDEEFEEYADDFEDEGSESDHDDAIKALPDASSSEPSEMKELMRAIAAENERANTAHNSSRFGSTMTSDRNDSPSSEQGSTGSESRDLSSATGTKSNPVTMINFMAAKSRSSDNKTKRRVQKQSKDLMNLIQLDTVAFDLIDMPPVTEYNLYIKNFGNSNTSQVSTQCKDDNLEQETQTEVPEMQEKWSQYPPHEIKCCGGVDSTEATEDSQNEERERMLAVMRGDSKRLGKFLTRACKLIESIIIEDELYEKSSAGNNRKSQLSFCEDFVGLETNLAYLQGRKVVHIECSPGSDVNLIAVAFEPASTSFSTRIDRKGIVTVWDARKPSIPEKVLVCDASPTCCCFSPTRSYVLFVGTDDGCVLAYDLREPGIHHQIVSLERTRETILRSPTYSTGYMSEGHTSPIVSITPVGTESKVTQEESQSILGTQGSNKQMHTGLAFQLASLEEAANLCIWIVVDLLTESDQDTDLGLAPHGKIKLLKSLNVKIRSPIKSSLPDLHFRTTCVQFSFSDPNHFYVGTDTGHIVHCTQYSDTSHKKGVLGSTNSLTFYNDLNSISTVTCIDINPFQCFGASLILAGYEDGALRLYLSDREMPILTWPFSTGGAAVVRVQWSTSRPSVFFVLDSNGGLHIWDAAILNSGPIKTEESDKKRICNFSLSNTSETSMKQSPEIALAYDAISNSDPSLVEVHKLAPHFSQSTDANEMEQLSAFLESTL